MAADSAFLLLMNTSDSIEGKAKLASAARASKRNVDNILNNRQKGLM